jgi:capsular exopolysaccharide synthesis family protein
MASMMKAALPHEVDLEERQANLRDYLNILRRRRAIIAGAFLLALAAAVAISLLTPPTYRATTTITADKEPAVVVVGSRSGDFSLGAESAGEAPDILTLAELVKSEAVRQGAMDRLAAKAGLDVAKAAVRSLTVDQVRQTQLIRISMEYTDPTITAEAANAIAGSLIDMDLKAHRRRATQTREFIGHEMRDASQRLHDAENSLVAFHDTHGDVSLSEETTLNLQKLADLKAQLVDVRLQRDTAESQMAAARERLASQSKVTPTQWTPSPLITSLQDQLAKLEIDLSGLRRTFTPKHPAVLATVAKIDETKQRLDAELAKSLRPGTYGVDPIYQQLNTQQTQAAVTLAGLRSRERAMEQAIAGYEERMRDVPVRQVDLARLTRDVKESEQIYLLLSDRYEQARIAESSIGSAIRVVDPAKVPVKPVKPRRQMNTLFGGLLGLMMGVVTAITVEHLDDTVKTADEVERVLRAPVLGTIPATGAIPGSARTRGAQAPLNHKTGEAVPVPLVTAGDRPSPAWEAYRTLRTHVEFSIPDVDRKRFLVTSALPGEGKSTVIANLAIAIARNDRRVWLIDGDLRRPTLWRWFGTPASVGLVGLLQAQVDLDTAVRPTAERHLWFLGGDLTVPNPSELLGSQRMARLMERARSKAEVVLVDSPPMLPVTDAEVVAARNVDGVLLVVKAGQTTRRTLAQVRKRLDRVGAKLVGAVLNCVTDLHRHAYDYYAYYRSNGDATPASEQSGTGTVMRAEDDPHRAPRV